MDCRQVSEVTRFATELYQEAVYVPFMSKFVVFAKRHDPYEAQLRVFCMTDDKEDKTLECQEHFQEIAKSRDVEVLEGKLQYLEFAGNIAPVTKSGEQLKFPFQAFHENRLPFAVRVKDPHVEPMGRIAFMREPKAARGEPPLVPICNLNVALPEITLTDSSDVIELVTLEKRYDFIQEAGLSKPELIHRADLRLSDIAQGLDKDWVSLAQQLDVSEHDIAQIQADATCEQSEQALMMLRLWLQKSGSKATGNELEKGLRKINREDIIKNCMFNVELVTDDVEKAVAKVHLDQSGFDVFKEELGSSRDASMRRGASLDISYDEQDIMKEAESAAETSSETGSLFERDQISQALTDDKELICQIDDPSNCNADDNVAALFPKCKKTSNQHSVEAASNDLNIKASSTPFDVSETDSNILINKRDTNPIIPETQTYTKQHEFWPSIPVTPVIARANCEQNLEKSNLNNKEISEHKDILSSELSKEESLNISNIIMSENGNKSSVCDKNGESGKSNDGCDFGYCSMDKVICASPVSDSDNASHVSKNHSEQSPPESPVAISPGLDQQRTLDEKANSGQTPELLSSTNENTFLPGQITELLSSTNENTFLPGQTPVKQSPENGNTFQTEPLVGALSKDIGLGQETSSPSSGVSLVAAESIETPVRNESSVVCTPGAACVTDGSSVVTVTTLQFEETKSENSKDNDNVDKVKEILLTQSTFENKFKEENLRGAVEVEQKLTEISGRQEIPARLTESETWPSLELDTSQVSISSLPEDEKSEPTTATVSDAVALAADTDENVESTDDKAPRSTQVIQTTTVMTLRSPDMQPTDEEGRGAAALEEELHPDEVRKVTEITTVTQSLRFERDSELPIGDSPSKVFPVDGAPVSTPQEVVTVTTISQKLEEVQTQVEGKTDEVATTKDPRHEFLDSLHEGKCDEDDSLQGDIPDVMRDSLLEERHLEDDSLHEMDILPDESSLSMESSFAAAISHDSSRAEDQTRSKRPLASATTEGGSVSSSSKVDKVEIVVSELPKCDIMLSSTDSLEQSSSAAAAFHFESESAMSTSLTGALASEDNTMISSTDTLEHEGRITFRYEDIPVDELEILVKDGRKVIVDSEGNIQTEYDVKHFLDSEDNLNDFNLSSKNLTEIKLPSTSTVHVQSALTSISYTDDSKSKYEQSATDESEEQSRFESSYSDPDVEVEEIHTTDEFGNPKVIKRMKKVITTRTQFSSSSSSENVEEKLKEFLREHAAGERAGLGEEVVQEERSMDDKGNVLLVRTVQQQVLSEPEVHSRTFTGPDAAALSEEYVRRFKDLDPTDDVCEYEKMDDQGNVVRVTQQVVIKPEVHSVSFSGPNARQQMEEYMRRFTQNGDAPESQSFSTVKISTTEQSQGAFPSERISHDLKGGVGLVQTTTSTATPESSEQIVRTVTTTCTTVTSAADDPGTSADQQTPSS